MNIVIIPAAGSGTRTGLDIPKCFFTENNETILERTIKRFNLPGIINGIVVLVPDGYEDFIKTQYSDPRCLFVKGGETRTASIRRGLETVKKEFPVSKTILIHDGARCFVSQSLIIKSIEGAKVHGAVTTAVNITDTMIINDKDGMIESYIPRDNVCAVQTPQAFRSEILFDAYSKYEGDATDDSYVVKRFHPVAVIAGEKENIKITTKEDLKLLY